MDQCWIYIDPVKSLSFSLPLLVYFFQMFSPLITGIYYKWKGVSYILSVASVGKKISMQNPLHMYDICVDTERHYTYWYVIIFCYYFKDGFLRDKEFYDRGGWKNHSDKEYAYIIYKKEKTLSHSKIHVSHLPPMHSPIISNPSHTLFIAIQNNIIINVACTWT